MHLLQSDCIDLLKTDFLTLKKQFPQCFQLLFSGGECRHLQGLASFAAGILTSKLQKKKKKEKKEKRKKEEEGTSKGTNGVK